MRKKLFLSIAIISIFSLLTHFCTLKKSEQTIETPKISLIQVNSTIELIDILKKNKFGELNKNETSPLIIIKNLPPDFPQITNMQLKRKIFIYTILPSALVAFSEIDKERKQLKEILAKLDYPKYLDLTILDKKLTSKDIATIRFLIEKYRTNNTKKLLKRINTVPISLLLAQAAMESNWGTSRFALEGNNLFGIWTYKREGIIPLNRDPNAKHKVAKYNSILEATRDYLYNLNVGWAYSEFREARSHTMYPIILAKYLFRYSQMGYFYAKKLQMLISAYNLMNYDDIYQAQFKPYFVQINLCFLDH